MYTQDRKEPIRKRAGKRIPLALPIGVAAALLALVLFLLLRGLLGGESWDATTALQADQLTVGRYHLGAQQGSVRESVLSKNESGGTSVWTLKGATLYFTGEPPKLTAAQIKSDSWIGPRGLRVGDSMDKLYTVLPVQEYEEQPEDFVLLYAQGLVDGLPREPYAVIIPFEEWLRAHLVMRDEDGSGFAVCDVYIDPDTNLITEIAWAETPTDDLLEQMM